MCTGVHGRATMSGANGGARRGLLLYIPRASSIASRCRSCVRTLASHGLNVRCKKTYRATQRTNHVTRIVGLLYALVAGAAAPGGLGGGVGGGGRAAAVILVL